MSLSNKPQSQSPSLLRQIVKPLFIILFPLIIMLSVLPGADGKPLMPIQDWLPTTEGFKTLLTQLIPGSSHKAFKKGITIYKWQDAEGVWQFSQEVPEYAQDTAEAIFIDDNLINTIRLATPDSENESDLTLPDSVTLPTSIAPQDIPKLIDNARKVRDLMNQRRDELNEL